jgi:hypothetical protein
MRHMYTKHLTDKRKARLLSDVKIREWGRMS